MSPGEKLSLWANLPALRAQELIARRGHELAADDLLRLCLEAGMSRDDAESAYCKRVLAQDKLGIK